MTFKNLNIIEPVLKALDQKGYESPTPIQEKAIPVILQKKDVLGVAQTGTGKTAAFAIPIIQNLLELNHQGKDILSLIVTPTRELAIQIDDNIRDYSKHTNLKHTVIFGGVKQGAQVAKLKQGVQILTATPGRLLDLVNQGHIRLDKLKIFVLDEADRMLDMGFINDIKKILQLIPKQRQSLFFSATMPNNIVKLSNSILDNPLKIEVTPPSSTAETIKQYVYYTNRTNKQDLLHHIIESKSMDQVLIFSRTKHGADRISKRLHKHGISSSSIHGNKAQNQRQKALNQFKEGKLVALVATDIAARGIDIDKLTYVINFDVPNLPETYVHRIGRSGRAGEDGIAISICEPEENEYMKDVQKLIGGLVEKVSDHPYPQTEKPMTAAEKKEWEKEKQKRKQEFFANRKAGKQGGGQKRQGRSDKPKSKSRNNDRPKGQNKSEKNQNTRSKDASGNNTNGQSQGGEKAKSSNGQNKQGGNQRKNKKGNHGKRRSTEMSDKLKNKFMWPLEK